MAYEAKIESNKDFLKVLQVGWWPAVQITHGGASLVGLYLHGAAMAANNREEYRELIFLRDIAKVRAGEPGMQK